MKKCNACCLWVLIMLLLGVSLKGTGQSFLNKLDGSELLSGYREGISGEQATYASGVPEINKALVVRNANKDKIISWKTSIIPKQYNKKYVSFVWLAGLATGKNRQNSSFDFKINNEQVFTIKIDAHKFPQGFVLKGKKGIELQFVQQSLDKNKDCFGYMYLKVPVAAYQKGAPLLLSINGTDKGSFDDWLMTFQYKMQEEAHVRARPLLRKVNNQTEQLVDIQINHIVSKPEVCVVKIGEQVKKELTLKLGYNQFKCWIPAVKTAELLKVSVTIAGLLYYKQPIQVYPVIERNIYLIPGSHTDIGYTDFQPNVAKRHVENIRQAMDIIEKSRDYPAGSRFKWNVESLWAVDHFLKVASEQEIKTFVSDVKNGSIGLSAGYINLLTGVCRPEELIHWTDYMDTLRIRYGLETKSLMESDVPGMNWSVVSALTQRGVRYISDGPNYIPSTGHPDLGGRVGGTNLEEGDKPFYWLSPSREDTVLYWQAGKGYSYFHGIGPLGSQVSIDSIMDYMEALQLKHYPFKMVQLRYTLGDNGAPDPHLAAFVRDWNKQYLSPKFVISDVDQMMAKFEMVNRGKIPLKAGDFSPYWADGVMSSAKEEVLAKHSVERLDQYMVLATLLHPENHKRQNLYDAWQKVVMWHEHTWGAYNSISEPDNPFAIKQWGYKKDFALQADSMAENLLGKSLDNGQNWEEGIHVINTSSWNRTNLVMLTKAQSALGDVIVDQQGNACPSQRLSDGRLAFLAKNIPALGSRVYYNKTGKSGYKSALQIYGNTMENDAVRLVLDAQTGAISSLINKENHRELVAPGKYAGLNQYIYMPGSDPAKAVSIDNVTIKIKEQGPLMATFEVSSAAPGTHGLIQQISLIDGLNKIQLEDIVDKSKVRTKESVHFAFPVNVPSGQMRVDLGTAVMRPEVDQIAGANKDYYCIQRWVDISNRQDGITFLSREVPLIEKGALIDERLLPNSSSEKGWKHHASPTNTFFSYAMNNYWYTNYKADQEGQAIFHYSLFVHGKFDQSLAARRGIEDGQPLLVTTTKLINKLPFIINDKNILLTAIKPAQSGKGYILRLYNASSEPQRLNLKWTKLSGYPGKSAVYLSDANEDLLGAFNMTTTWKPYSVKTLLIK